MKRYLAVLLITLCCGPAFPYWAGLLSVECRWCLTVEGERVMRCARVPEAP